MVIVINNEKKNVVTGDMVGLNTCIVCLDLLIRTLNIMILD